MNRNEITPSKVPTCKCGQLATCEVKATSGWHGACDRCYRIYSLEVATRISGYGIRPLGGWKL